MTDRDDEKKRIEREIRASRRADLASALAGRDGGGHLAGASPTPVLKRALLEIDQWLRVNLDDGDGDLRAAILARLEAAPDRLEGGLGRPQTTVTAWLDGILDNPGAIADLVLDADRRWGARTGERPHFEQPNRPASSDDPYTIAGVTAALQALRRRGDRD
jgi:hypothetical protein